MGHAYLSGLEQSCLGGRYYKQPILVRKNYTGSEFQSPILIKEKEPLWCRAP